MSENVPDSFDLDEPLDEDRADARLDPDPEVAPEPGLDVETIDLAAEANEADQLDQAWEVEIDDDAERG